jgi:hypothetical protein
LWNHIFVENGPKSTEEVEFVNEVEKIGLDDLPELVGTDNNEFVS